MQVRVGGDVCGCEEWVGGGRCVGVNSGRVGRDVCGCGRNTGKGEGGGRCACVCV